MAYAGQGIPDTSARCPHLRIRTICRVATPRDSDGYRSAGCVQRLVPTRGAGLPLDWFRLSLAGFAET